MRRARPRAPGARAAAAVALLSVRLVVAAPETPGPAADSASRASAPSTIAPPETPRARAARLLLAGRSEDAASAYAEALAADGADETAMEGRVRALLAAGRWQLGLEEARRHAAARPASLLVKSALGEALFRAGLLREAAATLAPLAPLAPLARSAAPEAPPARALMTLGLVRVAEGNEDEGARLLDRALALAPEDRDVILQAAGAAPSRAEAVARLGRYLERSDGDDPDRVEGARGTIRTYKALGERPVWVRTSRPDRVEVPLSSLRNPNGALAGFVVELATGSGKPIRVLLDSGSTGLFLLERIAVKGGFTPLAEETTFGGGGGGRHPTRTGLLPVAAIGGLRFADALVATTTDEIEPTGRYHGLLGLSVFQGYRVTIDLAREKLILERATPDPPPAASAPAPAPAPAPIPASRAASAPSAPPASSAANAAVEAPPAGAPAGALYWSVSSQMLVEASTPDGRSGLFLFDTGATSSLLSLDFADAAPGARVGGATNVRAYGGALRDAREVRGVRLRFQGLETSGGSMTASDLTQRARLGGVEVSGYLGLDLLARTVVTVDTVNRRVTVTKAGRK